MICSSVSRGSIVLQVLHTKYWELFFVAMICILSQVGQNLIVIWFCWIGDI